MRGSSIIIVADRGGGGGGAEWGTPLPQPHPIVSPKNPTSRSCCAYLYFHARFLTCSFAPLLGALFRSNLPVTGESRWLNYERDLEKAVQMFRAGGGNGGVGYVGVARLARRSRSVCVGRSTVQNSFWLLAAPLVSFQLPRRSFAEGPGSSVRLLIPQRVPYMASFIVFP